MSTLKRGLIILVAVLFLGVVTFGGAQAATTVRSSKSNISERVVSPGNEQEVTATTPTTDATTRVRSGPDQSGVSAPVMGVPNVPGKGRH